MIHELPRGTLHGYFSRDLEPVLAVRPGDSIRIDVPNAGWRFQPDVEVEHDRELHNGHPLAGPVEVEGARAGDVLVVDVEEVTTADWGVTWTGDDSATLYWELAGGAGTWNGRRVQLRPFLGVMGMPPPEDGVHSTGPPRRFGGNIDCKELVAGTTLYLPIPLDGARFSAGDGHAAQGDGEVSGTAIEAPVTAQLRLGLRDDLPLEWPAARIPGAWLTFGFDEQLGRAAELALEGMLALMQRELGVSASEALGLASVVVDLRVTQVVNGAVGVHAVLADTALA